MSEQYAFMKRLSELYNVLEDELSRKLFWARMQYDTEPSVESAIQFYGLAANLNLAICLYHKRGDMLAVMDYLHQLVPEYHFCIRHYSTLGYDTILYASVKEFPVNN